MATDDVTLRAEIRALTGYDTDLTPESEIDDVVQVAKTELRAKLGDASFDFYGDNLHAERALFWLSCLFLKVKYGEIDSPNFSISELRVQQPTISGRESVWLANFNEHLDKSTPGRLYGHTRVTRNDRDYAFEN